MAGPFVVSLKLIGDSTDAVGAIQSTERALESLPATAGRTTQAISFSTANVAAQFQDIGVTAFSGQSPLQIALQQGTQLSAVLGTQGAAGAVGLLKNALVSVFNPVSLLTIGVVGLTAAGIQWLMSMSEGAETAEHALAKHSERLDDILVGYKGARDAAKAAVEEALKLPKGAVLSDLDEDAAASLDRYREKLVAIRDLQAGMISDTYLTTYLPLDEQGPALAAADELRQLQASLNVANPDLDGLITRLTEIRNSDAAEEVRLIAEQLLNLAKEAQAAKAEVSGTGAALDRLGRSAILSGPGGGIEKLKALMPELRSEREQAAAILDGYISSARTTSEVDAAIDAYDTLIAALDQKDAEAKAKKDAAESARSAKRQSDYDRSIESIRDRTAAQQAELNVIGLSTFAAERLRMQTELETEARKDAIGLSPKRIAEIDREASAHARLAATIEDTNQLYSTGKDIVTGFITGIGRAASDGSLSLEEFGETAAGVFDKIRDKALGMLADGIWDMLFGALMGGLGGGTRPFASPGNFSIGNLATYATGTENHPGGWAQINEEGPEIVKLPRGSMVINARQSAAIMKGGGGSPAAPTLVYSPVINGGNRREIEQLLREDRARLSREFPSMYADAMRRAAIG